MDLLNNKVIITICIVVCIIICYYFYNDICNMKKLIEPTYQKLMIMETKVNDLEKKTILLLNKKHKSKHNHHSPAYSLTYNSADNTKKDNLSAKYCNISDDEAQEIINNIKNNKFYDPYQSHELQQILAGLESEPKSEIVSDVSSNTMKHISETMKYVNMTSDISSDIPFIKNNKLGSNILSKIKINQKRK